MGVRNVDGKDATTEDKTKTAETTVSVSEADAGQLKRQTAQQTRWENI